MRRSWVSYDRSWLSAPCGLVRACMADLDIALDTNCLTYVIDALEGMAAPPTDGLAEQKVALVRLFFYTPALWVTPTVEREALRISDSVRRANHIGWMSVHFGVLRPSGPVQRRATELEALHPEEKDCLVLAEAEGIGLGVLLSFDDTFVKRLSPCARLTLARPAQFWETLGIPRGAPRRWMPSHDNPLAMQSWWRW